MRTFILLILLFPLIVLAETDPIDISAKRLPNETYDEAFKRIQDNIPQDQLNDLVAKKTPVTQKVPVSRVNYSSVPAVRSYDELIAMFNVVRDSRFLRAEGMPRFPRRISWLYPDDGCYARAAISRIKLEKERLTQPGKIFAFGSLMVTTPYSETGYVTWWYHVAPVVSYMGTVFVLDPSLNPQGPLLVNDWYSIMGNGAELSASICNAYSYNPMDDCIAVNKENNRALRDQLGFLDKEWHRVSSLGFNPWDILGVNPPWLVVLNEG